MLLVICEYVVITTEFMLYVFMLLWSSSVSLGSIIVPSVDLAEYENKYHNIIYQYSSHTYRLST